nr:hypothetical protein [Tanacetum cinerariifolium]
MFQQLHGESLYEAWTRFKDLLQKVPHHADRCLVELENQVQRLMEAHLAPKSHVQVNKIASLCEICSGPYDTQYCMENPEQPFVEYASSRTDKARGKWLADGTKYCPIRIIKNVEVHIGMLKLLDDFYVIDMDKEPAIPLLVGRGFLATANVVIDYRKAKIAIGEEITRSIFEVKEISLGDKEITYWTTLDTMLNPFKDVLIFRKMVEFLGAIPINLKGNMWDSKELIKKKKIYWNRPPKEGDAFEKLLEDIHVTWTQFRKKHDKIAALREVASKNRIQCLETASQFLTTPSKPTRDGVKKMVTASELCWHLYLGVVASTRLRLQLRPMLPSAFRFADLLPTCVDEGNHSGLWLQPWTVFGTTLWAADLSPSLSCFKFWCRCVGDYVAMEKKPKPCAFIEHNVGTYPFLYAHLAPCGLEKLGESMYVFVRAYSE